MRSWVVTILLRVEILDLDAQALTIDACGYLGSTNGEHETPSTWETIFQSVYDAAAIEAALESCIYEILDHAQQYQNEAIAPEHTCIFPRTKSVE